MEGFYPDGKFGGLGSVHTRYPWPLGDAQALALAQQNASPQFKRDVIIAKLLSEVQWDGLFSEAVDGHTGEVTSKHWFSWPGSVVSTLLLDHIDLPQSQPNGTL